MSLPTPPSTAHRAEKENRLPRVVVWAEENSTHLFTEDAPRTPQAKARRASYIDAPKPILKPALPLLPWFGEEIREITPEPSDPLTNLDYLEGPVSTIIAVKSSLRDLIEAYSRLADRLRTVLTEDNDVDASWPLFQPLRKNRDAVVEAMARDIGRAFVDSQTAMPAHSDPPVSSEDSAVSLPSPKGTPQKKKKGMSAEQVKYARDLCTTCQSVIKLLSAMFVIPALYQIFTGLLLFSVLVCHLTRYPCIQMTSSRI